MIRKLMAELWADESGAVIATEYLMLGSIVGLGGASGLVAMRDAMVDEYKEFGQSVRQVKQSYSYRGLQSPNASVGGAAVVDENAPAVATPQHTGPVFSAP